MRSLGFYALALQEVQGAATSGELGGDVVDLVARSGPLSKVVLLILVLFSIVSWGVILLKTWQFRRIQHQTVRFLDVFRRSKKFSEVQSVCRSLSHSPLVGVFQAGYVELNAQLRQTGPSAGGEAQPGKRCAASYSKELRYVGTARCSVRRPRS